MITLVTKILTTNNIKILSVHGETFTCFVLKHKNVFEITDATQSLWETYDIDLLTTKHFRYQYLFVKSK